MKVRKRNGRLEEFNIEKIATAIIKAMNDVSNINVELATRIASNCKTWCKSREEPVDIEDIQDFIEFDLMKNDRKTAKSFIIYREERKKQRTQKWEMTTLQNDIYENKYRHNKESFEEFLDRVSGKNLYIKQAIQQKKFLPAGRILAGRGINEDGYKVVYSNCFVIEPPKDSIKDIFNTARDMAITYSRGGGVGIDIGKLRPRGAKVHNAAKTTSGAVSFMDLYSGTTGLIGQSGRRGALMISMPINHPDIEEFIDVKTDLKKVTKANVSVRVDDKFMSAVKQGLTEYELLFVVEDTGEVIKKTINPMKLFKKLATNNWDYAEPGMLFWDKISNWHVMSEDPTFEFTGVNPCAEEPLPAGGSCLLSSINLSEFVKNPFSEEAKFNYIEFEEMMVEAVNYMNDILDENIELLPLESQKKSATDLRQIGIGIMGMADMLIKLNIRYGSQESLELIDKIGFTMANAAIHQSALLAGEFGSFPLCQKDYILESPYVKANTTPETYDLVKKNGLRNSQLLTIAPTGSISTMLGISGGVEPVFQVSYVRKSESLHKEVSYYRVITPIVMNYMAEHGIDHEEDLPEVIVTSSSLSYEDRIAVQSAWQKHIDASISSTVNLPKETTVEDVISLYLRAWEAGCKGITIYRDGCARSGILITEDTKREDPTTREEIKEVKKGECPNCGGQVNHSGGCQECQDCGWSACSI